MIMMMMLIFVLEIVKISLTDEMASVSLNLFEEYLSLSCMILLVGQVEMVHLLVMFQ